MLELFDLLRDKKRQYNVASCLLLTGESGSGKSAIAKHYLEKNPIVEEKDRKHIPVLHYELRTISTPQEFIRSLLIAVGDPQQGQNARNYSTLYDRLLVLLKVTGVELLILDEVQVIIERRSAKVVTGIADLFKDLIKDTQIPIVFMGMPWSSHLVDSNQQLKGRISYRFSIPPYRISSKPFRDDYRRLLMMLSNAYEFDKKIALEETSISLRIFCATSGNLRATANLFRDALIMSEMKNISVDLNLLSEVMELYGVPPEENPFLLDLEKLELRELVTHSSWNFGSKANKNSIIEAGYVVYGITKDNRVFLLTSAA
ncbi:TniB family NTP-binding protein [Saccharospirillum mangrovi]|uniref:TniB family NTP-binding protein n=1 Tax=Saccharospirillum mangrovi TaxID=2161747 RepID=UPI000D3B3406|nr:TniB family NTP-binding protein [Saccharospirillum mangrovi]